MKKRMIAMLLMTMTMVSTLAGCGSKVEAPSISGATRDEAPASTWQPGDILSGLSSASKKEETNSAATSEMECTEACVTDASAYTEGCFDMALAPEFNTEEYSALDENGFMKVSMSPLSTFSVDVDTASYSNLRRFVNRGYTMEDIPEGVVRTEEMVNYFHYDYDLPKDGDPFGVTTEIGVCPWNPDNKLLSVGVRTEKIDFSEAGNSNIVFLIDVSGSMASDNKLPLLVKSFKLLLEELGEKDCVSIVTYASGSHVILSGVPASEKRTIEDALDGLMAGGGTNGGEGILSAYRLAEEYFVDGGNNRVILATDGDLNIGVSSEAELKKLIEKERKTGVFLTVLGFGTGNYSDTRMEALADYGNGNYAYIDDLMEAKKVLCEELGATLVTVAKDVKVQVEFNPAVVAEYRLIGYEDRLLNAQDFADDSKDAGEIGAGHTVTALYEIVTTNALEEREANLKYQSSRLTDEALFGNEWLTVNVRYKEPDGWISKLLSYPVETDAYKEYNSQDFLWAATVAEFSQLVRQEKYVQNSNLNTIQDRLESLVIDDEYKEGFVNLVEMLARNEMRAY